MKGEQKCHLTDLKKPQSFRAQKQKILSKRLFQTKQLQPVEHYRQLQNFTSCMNLFCHKAKLLQHGYVRCTKRNCRLARSSPIILHLLQTTISKLVLKITKVCCSFVKYGAVTQKHILLTNIPSKFFQRKQIVSLIFCCKMPTPPKPTFTCRPI